MKNNRDRDASDSESEDMCIVKVLAPQPNTDIIHQPKEIKTEEQDKVPVVRKIERNI